MRLPKVKKTPKTTVQSFSVSIVSNLSSCYTKYHWLTLYDQPSGPQHFWHQGLVSWKTDFPWTRVGWWGIVSEWSSALHLSCTYFYCYYIISTSDHQALDFGAWGPMLYRVSYLKKKKNFPGDSDSKESTCNAGDLGSIPGLGRSPRGEHGNPLQYSCQENPHGQTSMVGYSPWGCKKLDMTEWLSTAHKQ